MRRKTDRDIKKEYKFFLVLGILFILLGLFFISLPFIPPTPYEKYAEKEVVISKFDDFHGVRGLASYDYIITEDGEQYNITGAYNRSELTKVLTKGTVVIIRCRTNNVLPFKKYAEEITVNGNKIVTYNNDAPINWTPPIIFSSMSFLIGVLFLFAYRWQITQNKKINAKRDARIIKKYGQLKK